MSLLKLIISLLVSTCMLDTVDNVRVIEDADIFSDHHPVCFGVPTAAVGDVP